MRRPKTRGMVFAYEGSPAYIRSVREEADVRSWERDLLPLAAGPPEPTKEGPLDREGTRRPETGRPGNPTGP